MIFSKLFNVIVASLSSSDPAQTLIEKYQDNKTVVDYSLYAVSATFAIYAFIQNRLKKDIIPPAIMNKIGIGLAIANPMILISNQFFIFGKNAQERIDNPIIKGQTQEIAILTQALNKEQRANNSSALEAKALKKENEIFRTLNQDQKETINLLMPPKSKEASISNNNNNNNNARPAAMTNTVQPRRAVNENSNYSPAMSL